MPEGPEIRRAAEIDDRITREVMQQVENEPNLVVTSSGTA